MSNQLVTFLAIENDIKIERVYVFILYLTYLTLLSCLHTLSTIILFQSFDNSFFLNEHII